MGTRGEHLDGIARLQLVVQRHELAADLGADRAVPHVGVDRVREVHRRRPRRQVHHVALGREHEHLAAVQVDLQRIHELAWIGHVLQPIHHLAEPGGFGCVTGALAALLVAPVRRDAELRGAVHLARSDLDLERFAARADDRGVQRLVHVGLGHRHVVLEAAGDRLPQGMDRAEGRVGVAHGVDQDANPDQVVDLVELLAADHHLLVDGIQVFRTAFDLCLDAQFLQLGSGVGRDLFDQRGALAATRVHQTGDLAIGPGVQRLEREVFQLPFEFLYTQAVRERRIDLQGLGRDPALLRFGEHPEGAHVVQAVGELDQQDPDVARHGHDHLADVLRLFLFPGAELEAVQLGEAVDDARDLGPEVVLDRLHRGDRVFHRVVQERGFERRGVEAEVREDLGDRHRVRDEVLARLALLSLVRGLREREGPLDLLDVGARVVGANLLDQRDRSPKGPTRRPCAAADEGCSAGERPAATGPADPASVPRQAVPGW